MGTIYFEQRQYPIRCNVTRPAVYCCELLALSPYLVREWWTESLARFSDVMESKAERSSIRSVVGSHVLHYRGLRLQMRVVDFCRPVANRSSWIAEKSETRNRNYVILRRILKSKCYSSLQFVPIYTISQGKCTLILSESKCAFFLIEVTWTSRHAGRANCSRCL